jgi:uncharacterized protein YbjQ (UPF0145 family)
MTNILITTTPTVENRLVREYLGIVSGMAFMRRWGLGWLVPAYDPDTLDTVDTANKDPALEPLYAAADHWAEFKAEFHKARDWAIQQMAKEAASLGANAVIGVRIDYKTIDTVPEDPRAMMLIATGTAVRL